jgi:phosphoglycolate phosphatase
MIKTAVFDLDGTLIDTPKGIVDSFSATLVQFGYSDIDSNMIKSTIGLPLAKAFGQLMAIESSSSQINEAINLYQQYFKEKVLPKAKELVFPDVAKGLKSLKDDGIKLAVATNKVVSSAEGLIKAAGLWELFDLIVGANQVNNPKPHPEMGVLVMNRLESEPARSVMVGDTSHDLEMAKAVGMLSIGVTYGIHPREQLNKSQPTFVTDSFKKALSFIQSSTGV